MLCHHDYEAQKPDELTLKAGDVLVVTKKDDDSDASWWTGRNIASKETGVFPSNVRGCAIGTKFQLDTVLKRDTLQFVDALDLESGSSTRLENGTACAQLTFLTRRPSRNGRV